ncbi:MAG: hypothetical protein HYY06_20690 [Deltaproteobacteria bacterium]|nr:hypothetical protein [Deltaproteobacteria bacterium]
MPLLFTRPPDAPPETLDEYRAAGGYEALSKARSSDPEDLIRLVEVSGLLGRGGGGFPAARKWRAVRQAPGDEKYVIANGAEHEPGSRKDGYLITGYPHRVIEGLALAALATGARRAFLYLAEDVDDALRSASRALDDAAPLLADLEVRLVRAPGTYVAGEETAALSVIEGGGPWPRPKPPLPVQAGLRGRPTLVNNVETLAMVAAIGRVGLEAWGRGVMLCTLDDSFARPGVHEVPLGTTLRTLVHEIGGGTRGGRPVKAILPALSSAFLPASALDVPMTHDEVRAAGSTLGSAGVSVIEEGSCVVERALEIARFFQLAQCGQCPPCGMVTSNAAMIVAMLHKGTPVGDHGQLMAQLAAFANRGNCHLPAMAVAPLQSAVTLFPADFEAHARTGRCPE